MELTHVTEKIVHGLSIRTDNETEMDANKGQISGLWQTFDNTVPVDYKKGERVYGIYTNYESDHTGKFTVYAAFDGNIFPAEAELKQISIKEGKYLVFSHKGEMPQIAIDAWTQVWNYFSTANVEHQRLYSTDFEYYPNGNEIEVHIGIK